MKTKLSAWLLTLAMTLAVFSGCGAKTESSAPAPTASQTAQESAAPATTAPEPTQAASMQEASVQETEPEDEISKYVTPDNIEELIEGRPSVSLPVAEAGTSLSFWTGSPGMDSVISSWGESTAAVEMENRTGVHIDYIEVAPPTQGEALNLMFASGGFPDILNYAITGTYSVPYLIENDIAVDLTELMEDNAPSYTALMEADPALYLATVDDEGQIGGLAGYQYNAFTTTGTTVRSDWVEKVGMKVNELQTIEDYHDFLSAVKSQGLCEYPLPMRYDAAISSSPFLVAMGGYAGAATESSPQSFYYDDTDTMVYSYITDTYRSYITMMAEWYKEGLITRDLLNSDMLDFSRIADGSYAMFWQDCMFMPNWIDSGKVNDPDYMLAGAPEPKLEEGQVLGFGSVTDININLVICTTCKNPEVALQWLDYHFSEEGSILCQYGIEGEGLAYDKDGKPCYSDLISNNPDGLTMDSALNAYAININMYAKNGATQLTAYTELQQEALAAWDGQRQVTKSSFVRLFALNSEETDIVQKYYTDISTYVSEQVGKYLIGEADIDTTWDEYVATVESMGIDQVVEAYVSAGERYFGKLQ